MAARMCGIYFYSDTFSDYLLVEYSGTSVCASVKMNIQICMFCVCYIHFIFKLKSI